ncbi:flagellar radial spoke protein 5 isoform X3 [Phaseolus vulgaris]|uniref:flagellar radial spoke protein 5 isoform X3 n=1 Tax=Phaseolus vulgaris TaxID=3885 RepID=UPI0035CB3BAE
MECGRPVAGGAELIGIMLLMLCLNMLMLDSPLLIWLIFMDLLKIYMGFSSIEFVVSVLQNYWNSLTKWVPPPVKMTASYVKDSINVSRKRMDVESLDMLQFHWWDYSNPGYLDALKHLTDLKEEGKIKTVALTNFDTERLQIILENEIPVVSNQVQHSLVDMRPQQRMAELCQHTGVKLITYGTVMGGLLSEKFLDTNIAIPFAGPAINTPSLQKYKRMVDAWGGWNLFQGLLRTLKQVASKHGVSIATVAVKYILDQPAVGGSMVGVRLGLSEHIQDANAIFSLALDEDDVGSIREATAKGKDLLKVIGDCGDEYRRA